MRVRAGKAREQGEGRRGRWLWGNLRGMKLGPSTRAAKPFSSESKYWAGEKARGQKKE